MYLIGMNGLYLNEAGQAKIYFDNSQDETKINFYLKSCEEARNTGVIHSLSMIPQISTRRKDSLESTKS